MKAVRGTALGAAIRSFRLRKRRPDSGRPWSLDELANATDDDKAHLSRIERGLFTPSRTTLLRITQALELSHSETEFVLRLGGVTPPLEPPTYADAMAATRWIAQKVRYYLTPMSLYSIDARIWYANALFLRIIGINPRQFRNCIQGRPYAESLSNPCITYRDLAERYRDYDKIAERAVGRFRMAVDEGHIPSEPVASLFRDEAFRALWQQAEASLPSSTVAGEQSSSEVVYPGRGILRFDTWWCPLQIDRRFLAVLHMPRDLATRAALQEIRKDARPPGNRSCTVHEHPAASEL